MQTLVRYPWPGNIRELQKLIDRASSHHYHTGGVPGRHELGENQEIVWPAVMRAIIDTGFTGYHTTSTSSLMTAPAEGTYSTAGQATPLSVPVL
jgi:DNA-binding NtrC family response regulator